MFWKEIKTQFKLFDGIIIVVLIILSFAPYGVLAITQKDLSISTKQTTAIISIDGKEVDRFTLSEDTEHQLVTYHPSKKQYNIVEIEGTRIRVKEDNSPDQIAVKTGWISKPGQTSICLPHRLVVEIVGVSDDPDDDMIITY
ncbi:NusG domain II-containing protein [Vagococcus sp. BWB3-3]|uniref:NusG domain II-containing protein n=1 Tax=Vagococcus allomyrinae TaxID=2794353 RepID=A0A940SY26_9ENTE|nr:NusG domain II-containing protein [Vagococcus allomyrinae]MBP1043976.1 NusG domain II-containing protein [Vagococcus allomyrinae]